MKSVEICAYIPENARSVSFYHLLTLLPWYQTMSGGGTEYRLMWQVRLMVLPALTYTADSPVSVAFAAARKEREGTGYGHGKNHKHIHT